MASELASSPAATGIVLLTVVMATLLAAAVVVVLVVPDVLAATKSHHINNLLSVQIAKVLVILLTKHVLSTPLQKNLLGRMRSRPRCRKMRRPKFHDNSPSAQFTLLKNLTTEKFGPNLAKG